MCDYSDEYIIVKVVIDILAAAANENDKAEKDAELKRHASFRSCISKISNILMANADDFDIVMLMYNLLEYGENKSITLGSVLNYFRDTIDDTYVNGILSDGI